jgi:hypothetical protein
MDAVDNQRLELSVSEQSEFRSLREWLSWTPGLNVAEVAGEPIVGEQGALDLLAVVASSSSLLAAVRVLPEFVRAKRAGLSVTMTVRGKKLSLDATNVDEVMPIIERLLDA